MITEEFSFPVISSNNVVNLALLPPLWRISSINHSDIDDAELEQQNGRKRKIFTTFSAGEIMKKMDASENDEKAEAEAQEKMDVLWEEYFNEELQGTTVIDSTAGSDSDQFAHHHHPYYHNDSSNWEESETGEEYCNNVHELKMMTPKKKNSELVVKKMVKKLFLLQNMATIKKRGPN